MSSKKWLILIVILAFFSRFIGLNWGDSHFFHPDENNMATAVSGLSIGDLNPHFFAYGQFPLYLAFFSLLPFTGNHPAILASTLALRFWSAISSLLFLFFAYKLSKFLFKSSSSHLLFLLLLLFNPGLIQLAHFGTTESILCLVFMANLYFALAIFKKPSLRLFLLSTLLTAIGLASKITAVFFIVPIFLASVLKKKYAFFTFYLLITCLLFLILSPYNWLDFPHFFSTMTYETAVATGATEVFYTRQFLFTPPYLFPLVKIFPYISGLPVFVFSIIGFFFLISKPYFLNHKTKKSWFIVFCSVLIYFLYFGAVFTKWTRFFAPVFFIFPLLATVFLIRLKNLPKTILIILSCLPGLVFWLNYLRPDIRLLAAADINRRLPPDSSILSESGNVFPLPLSSQFQVTDFDFYELDFSPARQVQLDDLISRTDYILVPSRRVFKNQTTPLFPQAGRYYQQLFNGNLEFDLVKIYRPFDLFLNSENAEETWSVFDHPTLRLFGRS